MTDRRSTQQPDWFEGTAPPGSSRSILKWGGPAEFRHPNERLYSLMKKTFGMTDADFQRREEMGLEQVRQDIPCHMQKDQVGILDAIQRSGAAMSHHHGIGQMTAPWLEAQIGTPAMDMVRALKRHFDPHGIMNPGETLGLDLPPEQRRDLTKN